MLTVPSFVNTPAKEKHWDKCKEIVKKEYPSLSGDEFWAMVNAIFHRKYKKKKSARLITVADLSSGLIPMKRLIIDLSPLYEKNH